MSAHELRVKVARPRIRGSAGGSFLQGPQRRTIIGRRKMEKGKAARGEKIFDPGWLDGEVDVEDDARSSRGGGAGDVDDPDRVFRGAERCRGDVNPDSRPAEIVEAGIQGAVMIVDEPASPAGGVAGENDEEIEFAGTGFVRNGGMNSAPPHFPKAFEADRRLRGLSGEQTVMEERRRGSAFPRRGVHSDDIGEASAGEVGGINLGSGLPKPFELEGRKAPGVDEPEPRPAAAARQGRVAQGGEAGFVVADDEVAAGFSRVRPCHRLHR